MKTIAFFNSKGGAGKSTLAVHAGVCAAYDQATVLLDADPQGTLQTWAGKRSLDAPAVMPVTAGNLAAQLATMKSRGVALAIIDCPPYITAESALLVRDADFVVVPVQPLMPDLEGCKKAVAIIKSTGRPFAFVINRAPSRAPEIAQAQEELTQLGEVCPVVVGDRRSFYRALASGQSVAEFDASSAASSEAAALYAWILSKI